MIPSRLCKHPATHRLSRRDFIAAMAATVATGMPARAQGPDGPTMYFVPGGRIGFQRPAAIKPWKSSWHLLSLDHTLQVEVREALRIDPDWDDRLWQPERHVLVASGVLSPGIEHRRFRDQRYGRDADYGADTHVLRDDHWIGQIRVSTSTLGSTAVSVPGGQVARWQGAIDALVASLTVRPPPSASEAVVELRVNLTLDGLNPRLVGDQLILSLAPPTTPQEASGVTGSYISLAQLSLLPLGGFAQLEQATNASFAIYQRSPGSRVIVGAYCRGVVLRENRLTDGEDAVFSTTVMAFGRTRELKLSAFYNGGDRSQMLRGLEQVFFSLSLADGQ
jgi:hypothetical protein